MQALKATAMRTTASPFARRPSSMRTPGYRAVTARAVSTMPVSVAASQTEELLQQLLRCPGLDESVGHNELTTAAAQRLDDALATAMRMAYGKVHAAAGEAMLPTRKMGRVATGLDAAQAMTADAAHLLLQRVLYSINRLNHFW